MTGAVLAAMLVALALLVWTAPVHVPPGRLEVAVGPVLGAGALAGVVIAGDRVVPVLVAAAAGWAGWTLWQRRRRRRTAQVTSDRVREACEQLAAELGAGRPPGDALLAAATSWPFLEPASAAFRVGADVPATLVALSRTPGAGDLRLLAAAWQVSQRTGQGLAAATDRVASGLVAARRTRRVVDGELASARATARLVAALPLAAWGMGTGAGGSPLGFLIGSPIGWACLAAGIGIGLAGLWWIEAIARDVDAAS